MHRRLFILILLPLLAASIVLVPHEVSGARAHETPKTGAVLHGGIHVFVRGDAAARCKPRPACTSTIDEVRLTVMGNHTVRGTRGWQYETYGDSVPFTGRWQSLGAGVWLISGQYTGVTGKKYPIVIKVDWPHRQLSLAYAAHGPGKNAVFFQQVT